MDFLNAEQEATLTKTGYVPATWGHVWVGDTVMYKPIGHGRYGDSPDPFVVVDLSAKAHSSFDMETNDVATYTLVRVVAIGETGAYTTFTINIDHEVWVLQCEKNKRELFDLAAVYKQNLINAGV